MSRLVALHSDTEYDTNYVITFVFAMESLIKTPQSHPDHHTVGHHFGGYSSVQKGTAIFYCDSYDPRLGYWLTNVADPEDRKNVSEAAIGRTFHEAVEHGDHWFIPTWTTSVPKHRPVAA